MEKDTYFRGVVSTWEPSGAVQRQILILVVCLQLASWHAFGAGPAVGQGSLSGTVLGANGKPVSGALVAAVLGQDDHPAATIRSNADGTFRIVSLKPGACALTATAAGQTAGYLGGLTVVQDKDQSGLKIVLAGDGFTVRGAITDDEGKPIAGAVVLAGRYSDVYGDAFQVTTDQQGAYSITLPKAVYMVSAEHPGYEPDSQEVSKSEDQTMNFQIVSVARVSAPAQAEVVDWIRTHAIKLSTCKAGHGFSDMEPLKKMVGDARLVSLGEATHGTREFFQFKHRMLEFLVSEMGFTVFAIEASFPESLAVNDYVLNGKGDPAKALAGMYFWTWNTEEVLEMIRWMRKYNEDPAHLKKVKFYGFDMQFTQVAVPYVLTYLRKVDPEFAPKAEEALKPLAGSSASATYSKLPEEKRKATAVALADLLKRFDEHRADYIARSSPDDWALARQHGVIIGQAERLYGRDPALSSVRDRSMAQNIEWILAHEGPDARMVAWAHNGHISFDGGSLYSQPMGAFLKKDLGKDLFTIGFAFDQGSFQAMDAGSGTGLRDFTVGPSLEGSLNAALAKAGIPLFVLDLRQAPASGTAGRWWQTKHKERDIGAVYNESSADSFWLRANLLKEYDALFFVEKTTAAKANPSVARGGGPGTGLKPAPSPVNLDLAQGEMGHIPPGWALTQNSVELGYKASLTEEDPNQGRRCVVLSGDSASFGTLMQKFDAAPYRGKRVRFKSLVRVDLAAGEGNWAGLWMRVDLKKGMGYFDNMQDRPIKRGEWKAYEVEGDVAPDAESVNVGLLVAGSGKAWMGIASFEVVGNATPIGP